LRETLLCGFFDRSDRYFAASDEYPRVFNGLRSSKVEVCRMKSEYPYNPTPGKNDDLKAPAPSRFIDEKISDESGTETKSDSALAPAGLKNPFWN
jgi:hypothetical protein